MNLRCALLILLAAGLAPLPATAAAYSKAQLDALPPAASRPVDFASEVQPILRASCVKCHGQGKSKGGFQLDTRDTFLKDGDSGPAVIVGNSRDSLLIHLVADLDPDMLMPQKGTRLSNEQIGILRAWIDQGLKWDPNITFAREPHRNLNPRKVDLPAPSGDITQPVDRFVWTYFARHGIEAGPVVDDRIFARRVYLDVTGLLPTPDELAAFLKSDRADKREDLVRRLLADSNRYAQHWLTFWNDLLRNDYRGTGYIDGGREQITPWLFLALRDNKPYDQFVRELVNPPPNGPVGFTKGIVWRGVVNASQMPPIQAAQNISQVFLGVNLKCASCHDSFIDDWQLADAYGMASIYTDEKLELVQCDKPLGQYAKVKFLFPELGEMDGDVPKSKRVSQLADLMTHEQNGRLSRTIVNRLWAQFLGRGLVEPIDVMQNPAWDPDLLDWLAEDLVAHGYNLKRTMEQILTSRAYQLAAVNLTDEPDAEFTFRGPGVRRLTAEQFRDTLGQLTGTWYDKPEGSLDRLLYEVGESTATPASAYWIWGDAHAAEGVPPQTVYFRKSFELPEVPDDAIALVNVDNTHRLWVNGREARRKNDIPWSETSVLDLRPFLRKGANVLAVEAVNGGEGLNPAGLLFYARLRLKDANPSGTDHQGILDFGSDASWQVTTNKVANWEKADLDTTAWQRAQVLGPSTAAPWNLGGSFAAMVSGQAVYGQVRSALVAADPVTRALGRPNREQVTSERPYTATTIQMLELTNGETLARVLHEGAEKLIGSGGNGASVVDQVFQRSLGRKPTSEEARLSLSLVGERPTTAGVEDLLWSVAMLPEFQLIY